MSENTGTTPSTAEAANSNSPAKTSAKTSATSPRRKTANTTRGTAATDTQHGPALNPARADDFSASNRVWPD